MVLYLPNFSLVFLIHVFLYAGVYCMISFIINISPNSVFHCALQHKNTCKCILTSFLTNKSLMQILSGLGGTKLCRRTAFNAVGWQEIKCVTSEL